MTRRDIGYQEALKITLEQLSPLPSRHVPIWEACDLVLDEKVIAKVDSPSVTTSAKDGFALRSVDVVSASHDHPVSLRLLDICVAGESKTTEVIRPGTTVKVMTGAKLPGGADAVLATEFTRSDGDRVEAFRDAHEGRNLLRQGADIAVGQPIAGPGTILTPAMTGLMAAGGVEALRVHPLPKVALIATGDEVVAPGKPLAPGQLYASNVVTLTSWLSHFDMESVVKIVPDDPAKIRDTLESVLDEVDVVLTSGGAWKSARDLTPQVLEEMGVELHYHRVRLAPGKAAALGTLADGRRCKVFFCLPGGPPSNEMAFLQLALPGLRRLSGHSERPFPITTARLTQSVVGGHGDPRWIKFFQANLVEGPDGLEARPLTQGSRLACQAQADALIMVPTGIHGLERGAIAEVQVLGWKT